MVAAAISDELEPEAVPRPVTTPAPKVGAEVPAVRGSAGGEIRTLRLAALVLAVTLLWGINWPVMKVSVGEFTPFTFRAFCVTVAGTTLLLLAWLTGERLLPARRLLWPLVVASLFAVTGWHMFTAYGLLYVGGGRAAIIAYTMPVWAAVLSVIFLHERLTARRITALAIGMGAMGLLLIPDMARIGGSPLGALIILLAAMSWAAGIVATKAFDWQIGTLALTGWQLLVGGIPIVLAWPLVEGPPDLASVSLIGWLALAYVIFAGLVFCFSTHVRLIRTLPAMVAALVTLAIPVVGLLSSAIMLGEPIGAGELAALALVLVSLTLVLVPARSGVSPQPRVAARP